MPLPLFPDVLLAAVMTALRDGIYFRIVLSTIVTDVTVTVVVYLSVTSMPIVDSLIPSELDKN